MMTKCPKCGQEANLVRRDDEKKRSLISCSNCRIQKWHGDPDQTKQLTVAPPDPYYPYGLVVGNTLVTVTDSEGRVLWEKMCPLIAGADGLLTINFSRLMNNGDALHMGMIFDAEEKEERDQSWSTEAVQGAPAGRTAPGEAGTGKLRT